MSDGDSTSLGGDSDSIVGSARYLLTLLGLAWLLHLLLSLDVSLQVYQRMPERREIIARWVALRSWEEQLDRRSNAGSLRLHRNVIDGPLTDGTLLREQYRLQSPASESFDFIERAEVTRAPRAAGPHRVQIAELAPVSISGIEADVMSELLAFRGDSGLGDGVQSSSTRIVFGDLVEALRVLANLTRVQLEMALRREGEVLQDGEEGLAIAYMSTRESSQYRLTTPLLTQRVSHFLATSLLFLLETLLLISFRHRLRRMVDRPTEPKGRRRYLTRDPGSRRPGTHEAPWIMISPRPGAERLLAQSWRFWLRFLWWPVVLVFPWLLVVRHEQIAVGTWQTVVLAGLGIALPLWRLARSTADLLTRLDPLAVSPEPSPLTGASGTRSAGAR